MPAENKSQFKLFGGLNSNKGLYDDPAQDGMPIEYFKHDYEMYILNNSTKICDEARCRNRFFFISTILFANTGKLTVGILQQYKRTL